MILKTFYLVPIFNLCKHWLCECTVTFLRPWKIITREFTSPMSNSTDVFLYTSVKICNQTVLNYDSTNKTPMNLLAELQWRQPDYKIFNDRTISVFKNLQPQLNAFFKLSGSYFKPNPLHYFNVCWGVGLREEGVTWKHNN